MTAAPARDALDLARIRARINTHLTQFLRTKTGTDAPAHLAPMAGAIKDFVDVGGKRIRPLSAAIGWHAAGGCGDAYQIMRIAAGIEMLHAYLLIHDDVVDDSRTRRGRPTVQHVMPRFLSGPTTSRHAERFGVNAAIITGDLAAGFADELFTTAGMTHHQQQRVMPLWHAMRQEVLLGQYLDLRYATSRSSDTDTARAIIRYKTARYTVQRPLQIGAALNYADEPTQAALAAFGTPLGEAFQLRDDVLGVFGDPETTGKPVGDDLREGKHTMLLAHALRYASSADRRELERLTGADLTHHDVMAAQRLITRTGALAETEDLIRTRRDTALRVLEEAPLDDAAKTALRQLADILTHRES